MTSPFKYDDLAVMSYTIQTTQRGFKQRGGLRVLGGG
jgi:hypothetical protein